MNPWPALPLDEWRDTYATLHRWLQIVGKVRLTLSPWLNHSWHATLYVTPCGLTTSPVPYRDRSFAMKFDFLRHELVIEMNNGSGAVIPLRPQSVAEFYRALMRKLHELGVDVTIHRRPNELADDTPFAEDEAHRSYDPDYAQRFWRILVSVDRVFGGFRARFIGKCSPVHLFWGAADLAVTRFSGRRAPEHPGGVPGLPDWITREAYSHEVSSAGFWPGSDPVNYPAFYSYTYPEPLGFGQWRVRPDEAFYHETLREFILPYDSVRQSRSPEQTLMNFLQSSYEAAAIPGRWDRGALERDSDPRALRSLPAEDGESGR